MELQAKAVASEEHPHDEKQQEGGHSEAVTGLAENDAHEDENRTQQYDVFTGKCQIHKGSLVGLVESRVKFAQSYNFIVKWAPVFRGKDKTPRPIPLISPAVS